LQPIGRILILTTGELTRDPRARRQVTVGLAAGWDVLGACDISGGEEPARLDNIHIARVVTGRLRPSLRPLGNAARARDARWSLELRGLYQLLRFVRRTYGLVHAAKELGRVDIVHANDFDTLATGWLLARRWGAKLVYDSHELYVHKEPRPPAIYNTFVKLSERFLARAADAVITVSEPIADELLRTLKLRTRPVVVMNCPDLQEIPRTTHRSGPLRVVYQASAGVARFPEDVLDALAQISNVEVTFRIAGLDPDELRRKIHARELVDRAFVSDPVAPDQLIRALAGFDVGLVIDRPLTKNVAFALPNKLFEYLMAGLAVVVPGLPSMKELVANRAVGLAFEPGSAASLGHALQHIADDPPLLQSFQDRARTEARNDLNAGRQMLKVAQAWQELHRS
jgi:glycosyltransferase involved in cell wall biosynthesis